jgi:hypothetical protein
LYWRQFTRVQVRGIGAALIASLIGAGFSAQALVPAEKGAIAAPAATGYEAEDHFPGAAYYTAVETADLPTTPGVTGTVDLPELPAGIDANAVDGSIQPAAPFQLAGSSADRARALQCLTTAIYYEAAREPDDGQRAVAQVILNRVRHPTFPGSVCGVVYQGSSKPGCQFSFACDGSMARAPAREYWQRARRVAEEALAGSVFAPVGMATHYHTYAVTPSWNRTLVMTGVHGAHFFHRWKGWWGTAAAFRQAYAGREPAAAPHPREAAPTPAAPAASRPAAQVQTPYVESGAVREAYARPQVAAQPAAQPLPQSDILDKWKDSGQPIR